MKKNIDNNYDVIIQNMVKSVLKEYFDDNIVTEWKNVIYNIIIKVINNLRSKLNIRIILYLRWFQDWLLK
jgi:hypothetical protein